MVEEGVGQLFPLSETMLIKSIMIVGYGNTVNNWTRWVSHCMVHVSRVQHICWVGLFHTSLLLTSYIHLLSVGHERQNQSGMDGSACLLWGNCRY